MLPCQARYVGYRMYFMYVQVKLCISVYYFGPHCAKQDSRLDLFSSAYIWFNYAVLGTLTSCSRDKRGCCDLDAGWKREGTGKVKPMQFVTFGFYLFFSFIIFRAAGELFPASCSHSRITILENAAILA